MVHPASRSFSKSRAILDCEPDPRASFPFADFSFDVVDRFFGGII
jgi:hypothetical protein